MSTRDPLKVPCLTGAYWAPFEARPAINLAHAMAQVKKNIPKQPPPFVSGKALDQILSEEEANNRLCLAWMREHIGTRS